jgi:hypothetical protein
LASAAIAAFVALGCSSESSSAGYATPGYAGTGASSSSGSGGAAAAKPMLVVVDTDRVMNASPGDGVGVFTEYRSGGHWRIWWTCDTSKTSLPCPFTVTATSGAISNAAGVSLQTGDTVDQPNSSEVAASTTTTTSVQGMTFDTAPGATITLDAQMDGQETGEMLFFVQDGKIKGGYTGTLTDPLMLEPSTP